MVDGTTWDSARRVEREVLSCGRPSFVFVDSPDHSFGIGQAVLSFRMSDSEQAEETKGVAIEIPSAEARIEQPARPDAIDRSPIRSGCGGESSG